MTMLWVNGRRTEPELPAISAFDRGLSLGDGVFETLRATGGVIIHLDAHLERLSLGLARLHIAPPPHLNETLWDVQAELRSQTEDAVVRITVTRGVSLGVAPPIRPIETTYVVAVYPMPAFAPEVYARGLHVGIATGRLAERAAKAGLKSTSYGDTVLTLLEARARGVDDALVLDDAGHVAEGATSNLFVVVNGGIRTPPLTCGILPGITRAAVMRHFPVQETVIAPSDLRAADEVFLTSSLRGIAPVRSVDGVEVGRGEPVPGPVTRHVMELYARDIADEVADASTGVFRS